MNGALIVAKEVQYYAAVCLTGDIGFTDVEEWQELQTRLTSGIKELDEWEGENPDEEAERLLAILMGYCVAVRDGRRIHRALERAEQVFPRVQDSVLKCHLAVFCYMEWRDEELGEWAYRLIEEQKASGRGEEVAMVEKLLETMEESEAAVR